MKTIFTLLCIAVISILNLRGQSLNCQPDAGLRRRIVANETSNRYACYMQLHRGWFSINEGSGMLIHPRVVLTAGHNIQFYLTSRSFPYIFSSVKKADLYFGSTDTTHQLKHIIVNLKRGTTKFFNSGLWDRGINRDFSIIILKDNDVYNAVGGYYKVAPVTDPHSLGETIHITGSPGDKNSYEMWTAESNNFQVVDNSLRYDLFTAVRNSGSPIWMDLGNNKLQVVGVHSRSFGNCNAAVLIDEAVYKQIVLWCRNAGIDLQNF